jgi:8-oxo-dGTP diphosphatase
MSANGQIRVPPFRLKVFEAPRQTPRWSSSPPAMGLLIETDEVQRAARLYRFDERKYRRLAKAGYNFEL